MKDSKGNSLVLHNRYKLTKSDMSTEEIILCSINDSAITYMKINEENFMYTRNISSILSLCPISDVDIITDISDFIKNDKQYSISFSITQFNLNILLFYDPEDVTKKISITYDAVNAEINSYSNFFIDYKTVKIMNKIMDYMSNNKMSIENMCNKLSF